MDPFPLGDELRVFAESPGLLCGEALEPDLSLEPNLSLEPDLSVFSLFPAGDRESLRLPNEPPAQQPEPQLLEAAGGGGRSCGKVLGSEHGRTHSQRRHHVCRACGKAFKRHDHLSGHMLTHQKIKPFVCPERACGRSYRNQRSLRRHQELQHGWGGSGDSAGEGPASRAALSAHASGKAARRATASAEPGWFPPKPDLLRRVVSSFMTQNLALPPARRPPAADSCAVSHSGGRSEPTGDGKSKDRLSRQENAASSAACAAGNPGGASPLAESQLPGSVLPPFLVFQARKAPANQPSGDVPWVRDAPVCAEPPRSSFCPARSLPAVAHGPPGTFCERPDVLSFPAASSKAEEDALGESTLGRLEETFWSVPPAGSHPWASTPELSFPEVGKSESRWLLPKPPEPPRPQLFPAITEIPADPPEAADPVANPLPAGWQQLPAEYGGFSVYIQKTGPQFPGASSDCGKLGPRAAPGQEHAGSRGSSGPSQLSAGASDRPENRGSAPKKEAGGLRSWRLPAVRRDGGPGAAPPSQVAMASFAPTRRLTIFNRIQGGNIYSLPTAAQEENASAGRDLAAAPADGGGRVSLCQNCGRLVDAERGLRGHSCFCGERWHLPRKQEEQQVRDAGDGNAAKPPLVAAGDGNGPSEPPTTSENTPLVIPVSVPVTANEVTENEPLAAKDLAGNLAQQNKRQRRPKSLVIPAPGGGFQSRLRSPVFLLDRVLRDLVRGAPYTPPPMLSPVRRGSGLYFSTLCSPKRDGDPARLFGALLGRMDRDLGLCLMKDTTKISVQPRINVGSCFQADLPDLRDRSHADQDEEPASLVWKPWGDIATNPDTQDRVAALLTMARSSAVPGGGTNLELALHCLHAARGDVLEALDMLLVGGPPKSESHPLANYHYAGSDTWTPLEKQLFHRAFRVHKKDFFLIHKKIQTKSVAQCVEYYYSWKKTAKFGSGRTRGIDKKLKRDKDEVEEAEEKAVCSPRKRRRFPPEENTKIKQKTPQNPPARGRTKGARGAFPCAECGRAFARIRGRNAHMKSHHAPEPLAGTEWPPKCLENEEKAAETAIPAPRKGGWGDAGSE